MYRGTLTQSADPETKKDVAIKTIRSMYSEPSPVVPHNSPQNLYFRFEVNCAMHEFWPLKTDVVVGV